MRIVDQWIDGRWIPNSSRDEPAEDRHVLVSRRVALFRAATMIGVLIIHAGVAGPFEQAVAGSYGGRWVCTDRDCEPYIYDPSLGDPENIANPGVSIPPGTAFMHLPTGWRCPICGAAQEMFIPHYEVDDR